MYLDLTLVLLWKKKIEPLWIGMCPVHRTAKNSVYTGNTPTETVDGFIFFRNPGGHITIWHSAVSKSKLYFLLCLLGNK